MPVIKVKKNGVWEEIGSDASTLGGMKPDEFATASDLGDAISNLNQTKVPTTRTINGKALSEDITLTADDIGVNIYTDTTLAVEGAAADAKAVGEALANIKVDTDDTLSVSGSAADAKITGDRFSTIESQIADLLYKAITITSFKNNGNTTTTVEKGSIIADVTLAWETSKTPKTLTLDGNVIDASSTRVALTNLSITSDKTWTLKATDERDAIATKTTKIAFVHGVYYGVIDSGVTVNSSVIHNLVEQNKLTKSLQSSKSITFAATANADQHIMFAMPTSYGTPMFKDKDTGFEAGFYKANTMTFVNSNDYDESYDIWLSTNTGLGTMNVVVS